MSLLAVAKRIFADTNLPSRIKDQIVPGHVHGKLTPGCSAEILVQGFAPAMRGRWRTGIDCIFGKARSCKSGVSTVPSFGNSLHQGAEDRTCYLAGYSGLSDWRRTPLTPSDERRNQGQCQDQNDQRRVALVVISVFNAPPATSIAATKV